MARLTDPQFRRDFALGPAEAAHQIGLGNNEWLQRLTDCDPVMFNWVAEGWDRTRNDEALFEQDSEDSEWAAWADQLAKP